MTKRPDSGLSRELDREVEQAIGAIGLSLANQAQACGETLHGASTWAPPTGTDDFATCVDRRAFMRGGAAVVAGAAIAGPLQMFFARRAQAHYGPSRPRPEIRPYGQPVPTLDEVTGLPLIGLPPGFRYWSHGWTGDPIFDHLPHGPITPPLHDGMGVLRQVGPLAVLCRNHEAGVGSPAYVNGSLRYSPAAGGGNTNLIFDTHRRRWLSAWPTLSGTVRNCGGGITPHGTWLSCEESGDTTTGPNGESYPHGWVFEVPAVGLSNAKPIKAMGRRSHEAAAVDPRTGIVYITEDASPGGVYRFIPNRPNHKHFDRDRSPYAHDGRLQMLKVVGRPNVNLFGQNPVGGGGAAYPVAVGAPLDVEWVPIADPENTGSVSNFGQGAALGGAQFRRPEGTWFGDGKIYFVCTDGGISGNGQVFSLDVRSHTLTLIYDAPTQNELDNPDNVVVTPRGVLLFCEDNSGSPSYLLDGVSTERLVGLTKNGEIFTFATNLMDFSTSPYTRPNNAQVFGANYRANEWAGATFDASGHWLFVNVQTPGVTFAITGPWTEGPL